MVLIKGYTQKSICQNIQTEIAAGKSHQQSVAVAMHVANVARMKSFPQTRKP